MVKQKSDGRRKTRPPEKRRVGTSKKGSSRALETFESRASEIMRMYRLKQATAAPFDTAAGFLKREAYALIRHTIDQPGGTRAITKILKEAEIVPETPTLKENPFFWGLLAMDTDAAHDERAAQHDRERLDSLRTINFLDRRTRSRYAWQMHYAHQNRVPPEYLVGFLYQVGGPKKAAELCREQLADPSLSLLKWHRE